MNSSFVETDADRLAAASEAVARAARDCGRRAEDIALVCVSKTIPQERLTPLLAAGHRIFGENRVQEAAAKWPALRASFPDLRLRLIGPLQSNKAREAVALFDAIETLDRPRLAEALAEEIARQNRIPEIFIQVNIGREPQKAGVDPVEADAFIGRCREEFGLPISGLMCIPPQDQLTAPYFALLGKIARRNDLRRLSMGMSSDFECAIQLGATEARIGSAIFGARG